MLLKCIFSDATCLSDQYKCSTGDCISKDHICDNIQNDCEGNEDESEELCGTGGKSINVFV